MSKSTPKLHNIPELSSETYPEWSQRVKAVLKQRRWWDAVDPGFEEEEAQWNQRQQNKNEDVIQFLTQIVDTPSLRQIREIPTAKGVWKKIKEIHCSQDGSHTVALLEELCSYKKPDDTSMREYIEKVETLCDMLHETGMGFTDNGRANFLLRGLPRRKYEVLIATCQATEEGMTKTNVINRMILTEKLEKLDKEKKETESKALMAAMKRKGYGGQQQQQQQGMPHHTNHQSNHSKDHGNRSANASFLCFNCNETGHFAKNCPKLKTFMCYRCNETGHTSARCPAPAPVASSSHRGGQSHGQGYKKSAKCAKCENFDCKGCSVFNEGTKRMSLYAKATVIKKEVCDNNSESDCEYAQALRAKVRALGVTKKEDEDAEEKRFLWIIDGGCTDHMTPYRDCFETFNDKIRGKVEIADGVFLDIMGGGTVKMQVSDSCGGWELTFSEVLYVPNLEDNLLSVRKLDLKGLEINIKGGKLRVLNEKEVVFTAPVKDELYQLQTVSYVNSGEKFVKSEEKVASAKARKAVTRDVWHQRFGHVLQLPQKEIIPEGKIDKCDTCIVGKFHRKPFPKRERKSTGQLDLMFSDVCEVRELSIGQAKYFVTFMDDYSRYAFVKPIAHKSDVFEVFKKVKVEAETMLNKRLKALQTDNGREYVNLEFEEYLLKNGIHRRLTIPYTSEQNGVAERLNRLLMMMVRCMLLAANLPWRFWGEAIFTACYLRNRCCSKSINGQIPYELWFERELLDSELTLLKVFGCEVWTYVRPSNKLQPRASKGIMLGYAENQRAYRIWDLERKEVILSRDAEFIENIFPFQIKQRSDQETICHGSSMLVECLDLENEEELEREFFDDECVGEENNVRIVEIENDNGDAFINEEVGPNDQPRRSSRERKVKEICACCRLVVRQSVVSSSISVKGDNVEPTCAKEALCGRDSFLWLEAMQEEINCLLKNDAWEIVPRPKEKNVVGSRWVFKIKRNQNGMIERFRARLVAQGFSQVPGMDFSDTYSPVVNKRVIRTLLAVAVEKGWHAEHIDIKSAYLHSELTDEVYMEQPEFFEQGNKSFFVCKLKKSLYGLHQAARDWSKHLDCILTKNNLVRCISEPCVYYLPNFEMIVSVYVDDIVAWGNKSQINIFKENLAKDVDTKDLGSVPHLLSLNVNRPYLDNISVNQRVYAAKICKEEGLADANPVMVPMTSDYDPVPKNCDVAVNDTDYRKKVGKLLYLSTASRPDLCYAVCRLSQNCSKPMSNHMCALKKVYRYLVGTYDYKLDYSKTGKCIEVFSDADYGGDRLDRTSTSGYVVKLGGAAISWSARKQRSPATSTLEAEYLAMTDTVKETKWLMYFLTEIGQEEFVKLPCVINVDNQAAISLVGNCCLTEKSKHIDIKCHFMRYEVEKGYIQFKYVMSNNNVADIMTKPLSTVKFKNFVHVLGLKE